MFDWVTFLQANNVPYVTSGPNVSRGRVAIKCPYCGTSDPSEHLSIGLNGEGWRCWRNHDHRGKSPVKLIATLAKIPWEQAARIAGMKYSYTDDFMDRVNAAFAKPKKESTRLLMPAEFLPIEDTGSVLMQPYVNYLAKRGLGKDVYKWARRFDLRYCLNGEFGGRVVFPVRFEGALVSWTARSIGRSELRYKAAKTTPPLTNFLLWYDQCERADADTIYLVEGPFDALNVWRLGMKHGIVATCFFTAQPSKEQLDLLTQLLPKFKHRYTLLDQDTPATFLRVSQHLAAFKMKNRTLPKSIKDPALLQNSEFLFP